MRGNSHARFLEGESSRGPTYLDPALIGGFGNFLLPLGLGGPDMAFPRLNNISYLSLIPSIVLFLFAGGIENGVGMKPVPK